MAMRGKKQAVDDGAIRALLKRYACPLPYHEVRARFMGNIATPDMNASPMKEVQRLWNDDFPESAHKAVGTLGGSCAACLLRPRTWH